MHLGVKENPDIMQPRLKWFIEQDTQKRTPDEESGVNCSQQSILLSICVLLIVHAFL